MPILWAGTEDFDFPNGLTFPTVDTTGGVYRSAYVRCGLYAASGTTVSHKADTFAGGAVTSCWVAARVYRAGNSGFDLPASQLLLGVIKGSTAASGVWVTISSSNVQKLAIAKFDGTTLTQLATESGTSFIYSVQIRLDLQIISYGASATVNLYVNGALVATYTGDVTVSGVTSVDTVAISGFYSISFSPRAIWSELIAADEDTRAIIGLATMAPTGAGTTDDWTGAYTDVNELGLNDGTMISTNVVSKDEQFNITDVPAGNYGVKAVVVAARSTGTASGTATKIALGFNSAGTVAVGTAQTTTTAWVRLSQVFATNPVTSAAWVLGDMNALQVDLQSS